MACFQSNNGQSSGGPQTSVYDDPRGTATGQPTAGIGYPAEDPAYPAGVSGVSPEAATGAPVDPDGEGPLGPQPPDLPAVCDLGADRVVAYTLDATGTLIPQPDGGATAEPGSGPRHFAFSPDGGHLYCCNQRADHVTVFKADRKTGALTFTGHYAPVGNPS